MPSAAHAPLRRAATPPTHPTPFGPLSHQLFQFPAPQVRPAATCATTQLTLPEDMSAARRRGSSSIQHMQPVCAVCMQRAWLVETAAVPPCTPLLFPHLFTPACLSLPCHTFKWGRGSSSATGAPTHSRSAAHARPLPQHSARRLSLTDPCTFYAFAPRAWRYTHGAQNVHSTCAARAYLSWHTGVAACRVAQCHRPRPRRPRQADPRVAVSGGPSPPCSAAAAAAAAAAMAS